MLRLNNWVFDDASLPDFGVLASHPVSGNAALGGGSVDNV